MKKKCIVDWPQVLKQSTVMKATNFSVIFRNGVALKGFAKHGTAQSNCDPEQEDHVVDGVFGWEPKPSKKPSKRKAAKK